MDDKQRFQKKTNLKTTTTKKDTISSVITAIAIRHPLEQIVYLLLNKCVLLVARNTNTETEMMALWNDFKKISTARTKDAKAKKHWIPPDSIGYRWIPLDTAGY
jgi:hypothetical protein